MKPLLILLTLPVLWAAPASGQKPHPKKSEFADSAQWSATAPGQVSLKDFATFRAVYTRSYTQGAGPKAGQPRTDRVIVTADRVGWDGREAVLFNMIDSGEAHFNDTNGRSFAMYFDLADQSLLFELGPIPGKGKDYYFLRALPDKIVGAFLTTETGEAQPRTFEVAAPGFGAPVQWLVGSMDLKPGRKLRFDPVYSLGLGAFSAKAPLIVRDRERIKGGDGRDYRTWVVDSVANLTSAWVQRSYISDAPPYLIRRESHNRDSGEKKIAMDLIAFQAFER